MHTQKRTFRRYHKPLINTQTWSGQLFVKPFISPVEAILRTNDCGWSNRILVHVGASTLRYICMHVRCTNTTSTSKIVNHSKPIKHSLVSVISTWIHKHQLAATAIAKRDTRISDWWWDLLELKTLMHIRVRGEVDHLQHSICEHRCIMINDIIFYSIQKKPLLSQRRRFISNWLYQQCLLIIHVTRSFVWFCWHVKVACWLCRTSEVSDCHLKLCEYLLRLIWSIINDQYTGISST